MSVFVKNLDIPRNCRECPIMHEYKGMDICTVPFRRIDNSYTRDKPEWCPLVEVSTPHGRLIDGDYLKEHITACATNGRPLHKMELSELLEAIDDVPTVIEEEIEHD